MEELLGAELYAQVKEKIGDKELFINDGSYIPKKKFDDINNDKKELQKQLEAVNSKVTELEQGGTDIDKIKQELQDLHTKYDEDTKALNDKISSRERDYVVEKLTTPIKFSSESAKKSFIRDLSEKDLKIEDGKMLGFDDYLNSYKETDPNAFEIEKADTGKEIDLGGMHTTKLEEDDSFERKIMGLM